MKREQLKSKIEEQQAVYHALKEGDNSIVCYKEFQNGEPFTVGILPSVLPY